MEKCNHWREEINKLKKCPQRQDSVSEQMIDLYSIAVKLGFYDASDYIKRAFIDEINSQLKKP